MLSNDELRRYSRHLKLDMFGLEGQKKLITYLDTHFKTHRL
jgi:molybdopterin/thiamine biosynthesis adenylyltransferase